MSSKEKKEKDSPALKIALIINTMFRRVHRKEQRLLTVATNSDTILITDRKTKKNAKQNKKKNN